MRKVVIAVIGVFILSTTNFAQASNSGKVLPEALIEILKAEDELRYDKTLEAMMKASNPILQKRAALAAGRIGDEDAIPALSRLLFEGTVDVRQMAAFALGEIESIKAADYLMKVLNDRRSDKKLRASAIEAAGKIAAANTKEAAAKALGKSILDNLEFEAGRRSKPSGEVILRGITAALRSKPEGVEKTLVKFVRYAADWRIRADSLNALARLRAKNANTAARHRLIRDTNPIVRANAARVLGAAKASSFSLLVDAGTKDPDLRVRVNAIRALSGLGETYAAPPLLKRAEKLLIDYKNSKYKNPIEKNELLTIASSLGNILKGTEDKRAIKFLNDLRQAEKHRSPEVEVALVRVSPASFIESGVAENMDWRGTSGFTQGLGEFANLKDGEGTNQLKLKAITVLGGYIKSANRGAEKVDKSFPSILRAYAKFKTDDLPKVLRDSLKHDDEIIRATAASLLGDVELDKTGNKVLENYFALRDAYLRSQNDELNEASTSSLNALKKQYEKLSKDESIKIDLLDPIRTALRSPDYFVRRTAATIFKELEIQPDVSEKYKRINFTRTSNGLKSRVVIADYQRALARKNGMSSAILETEKGKITINFFPEDAPLTVDNFIKLAKSGYFNGLAIHRVVPNFVVQDGDSRGDGNGGPGWQIRCEINQLTYERGMVGMALAGKDSGGSQWFVTHSPQPHLDGGYTIFGKVNDTDMKITDNLVRGDKILTVKIVEKK